MKILIIEDESGLRESIRQYLEHQGYTCEAVSDYNKGSEKIDEYIYDCIVVDIGLPGGSGLDLVKQLKSTNPKSGIIIISAKNSLEDKLTGLELGSDDYITKPFHLSELNARIKAVIRRRSFEGNKIIVFQEIINISQRSPIPACTLTRAESTFTQEIRHRRTCTKITHFVGTDNVVTTWKNFVRIGCIIEGVGI